MSTMLRLRLVACLLALLTLRAESASYEVFLDERIFQESCDSKEDKGNVPLSELLDNHLTSVLVDDTSYMSGDLIVKAQLPPGHIRFEADISRRERGRWVQTFVSLKRDNFCKSLFDPFELWHLYIITQIPRQQRICPPQKGFGSVCRSDLRNAYCLGKPMQDFLLIVANRNSDIDEAQEDIIIIPLSIGNDRKLHAKKRIDVRFLCCLQHVYTFQNISNRMQLENMPRWNIVGDIKAVLHFSVGNLTTCVALYCTVSLL
ncbi:uncharacterized protein LOC111604746 [Drosophila hydei]|uniref:Uncharacterized protein LOC111604746 n=1 Tax=Drosophila hydei TaxID=7224 RepID=A0A6J1MHW1_DROHY|nr:uncharacterized protein LOC111604746 [Drosophila hydei]